MPQVPAAPTLGGLIKHAAWRCTTAPNGCLPSPSNRVAQKILAAAVATVVSVAFTPKIGFADTRGEAQPADALACANEDVP